jgi:hypothetical protein
MTIQNKYQRAKIYQIRSHRSEMVYIGSTCEPTLARRFVHHRSEYKCFQSGKRKSAKSSREILEFGDAYIELIENFPCSNKDELVKREGHHIRLNNCVNKRIAGRTLQEYYIDNKESLKIKKKQYYEDNKELIKQRDKKIMVCHVCNSNIRINDKIPHIKSVKHIKNYKQEYFNCWGVEFTGVLDSQDY